MFTNYRPHVAAEDNGTWRRLHVIPFTATMPTGDAEITDYASILAEQAGGAILKWLIEGAGEYIEAGHKLPMVEAMDTAKQEYRSSEDYTAAFIRERCIEEPTERIPLSVLYSEYRQYTQAAGVFTLKSPDFRSKLEQSGYTIKNTGNRPAVCGLKLAPSEG